MRSLCLCGLWAPILGRQHGEGAHGSSNSASTQQDLKFGHNNKQNNNYDDNEKKNTINVNIIVSMKLGVLIILIIMTQEGATLAWFAYMVPLWLLKGCAFLAGSHGIQRLTQKPATRELVPLCLSSYKPLGEPSSPIRTIRDH